MSTHLIPQYLRSCHAEVVAAVGRHWQEVDRFYREAEAFAAKHGVHTGRGAARPVVNTFAGSYRIVGVTGAKPTVGRWTALRNGLGWRPYLRDPINAERSLSTFESATIPGLPFLVEGPAWVEHPEPFVVDGVAWLRFPEPGQAREPLGPQWEEALASKFYEAREAFNRQGVNVER